jgi:hypothetical protein
MRTERRTDSQTGKTELKDAFRNYANAFLTFYQISERVVLNLLFIYLLYYLFCDAVGDFRQQSKTPISNP